MSKTTKVPAQGFGCGPSLETITRDELEARARERGWDPQQAPLESFCREDLVRFLREEFPRYGFTFTDDKIRRALPGLMRHPEKWSSRNEFSGSVEPLVEFWKYAIFDRLSFMEMANAHALAKM